LKNKRLLVDTSFLLPALGVEVEKNVVKAIEQFHLYDICYLEISLLEAMWCILKLIPPSKLDVVEKGIEAIRESYELLKLPSRAYIKAYEIYSRGHKDYIDNLIYATSTILGLNFLTIDLQFINFLKSRNYPIDNIVTPRDLIQ